MTDSPVFTFRETKPQAKDMQERKRWIWDGREKGQGKLLSGFG